MYRKLKKELHTLSAAVNVGWNWRNFRPAVNPVLKADNPLSDTNRAFMEKLGVVAGGNVIIYGGALNDLVSSRPPKDFDGFILTKHHPLLAMHRIEAWARSQGYDQELQKRRIRLLWKRVGIKTEHGVYDLSCLHGKMSTIDFVKQLADEADVSPCARAVTLDYAYQSQRCVDGEMRGELIFRPMVTARTQFSHFDRWVKYALDKYPERPVVYQDEKDAVLFAELAARRAEIQSRYNDLREEGQKPKNFVPFAPLFPALYGRLSELARAEIA